MDVTIGISADATGVEAGVRRSKRSLADLGKTAKEASQGIGALGDGGDKSAKKIERDTRTMQQSLQRYIATLKAGSKESRVYWEQMADFKGINKNALRPLLDQLDELKRKQQEASGASGGLISSLGGLRAAASVAIGGFAVQGLLQATAAMYSASAAAERLRIGLDFASARGSADEINYLRRTTYDLGLQFQSTAQSYMQFQAAAKGTTLEGDKARAVFESVAKASAVMGLSAEQNSGVLLALQQMVSKGTVQAEELRGQLGERLPGAFQIAARSMGVTTAELGKMLEMGEVISEDFLPKFAAELEKTLGDAPEKAANRLDASINRYNNAWEQFKQSLGDSGVSQFWSGQMDILSDGLMNFNQSIESARAAGAGFGGQLAAAAGAALEFLNPVNAIGYSALETGQKLKEAEKRLQELKDAGAQSSSNLMLRESYNHAQRLVDKLREAKRAQDSLAAVNAPVAGGDPYNDGSQYASYLDRQKKLDAAQQGLLAISARDNGISKAFTGDLRAYEAALETGAMSVQDYAKAVTELNKKRYESTEAGKAEAKAAKDGAKGNKEGESAILSYIKSLEARTAAQRLEIAQGDKLTESQRARIQLEALLADSKNKASKSQVANAQALLAESEANEAWLKNASDVEKAIADMQKAREQSLQSVQDSVKKLVEEAEAAAYAETHNISLAEAVERLALARAENAYQQAVERQESQQTLDFLRQEIDARKQLVTATAQKEVKEANKKAAEQAAKDWEKVSQTIGDTLADYIMAGGKDAATYLKRLFSTLVLQPVVQTVVGSLMGTGTAAMAGSGAGLIDRLANSGGSLTNWTNLGGNVGNWLSDAGFRSINNGFTGVGESLHNLGQTIQGVDAWFKDAVGLEGGIGSALGYANALHSLSQGQYGSAIGSAVGTYILPGIGTMIGGTLGGFVDSLFGDDDIPRYAATSEYRGGVTSKGWTPGDQWNDALYPMVSGLAGAIGSSLDAAAKTFGKTAGYELFVSFSKDADNSGVFGAMNIKGPDGQTLVDWSQYDKGWGGRWFSDGDAGAQEFMAAIAADVKTALTSMDLPGWSDQLINAAQGLEGLNTALQQIGAIKTVFDSLGQTMDMFAGISGSVQTTLLNVSGGIDALTSNAQSFYANYFSEQERLDATVASLTETFSKYGAALPATTEQYRALVEQQMAAGEAGAELAAVLLGMSGTFASVADAWSKELDGMAASVTDFFADLNASIGSLLADVESLRKDILRSNEPMTAEEIRAAIGSTALVGPSSALVAQTQASTASAAGKVAQRQTELAAQKAAADAKQQAILDGLNKAVAPRATAPGQSTDALWESIISARWDAHTARFGKGWNTRTTTDAERAANMERLVAEYNSARNAQVYAAADQQRAQDAPGLASSQAALDAAKAALDAAQKAEMQSKVEYAEQMKKFVADAGASVSKLSDLRGEVMSFYEAQAQAVQAMLQSAGNLRSVVDAVRLGQLSTAQTAQELGQRYAVDYAMALSTTGSTRAGYVDAMAGNLQGLSEAMKAEALSGAEWRVQTAKLLAQATNAAGLLEGDAESDDYQDVALGLLDSIDQALAGLSGATKTAEQVIADAVNNGTQAQLEGLRAIVAALTGKSIPAFAAGGLHAGGMRLVGERGPELEVTGPARYWNANQTQAMLGGGGGNSERTEKLLAQLIEENRVQAARIVDLQLQQNKLLQRWDAMGMPEEREVTA